MTAQRHLRLLPWAGPDGKPCYLSTDDPEGFMSRLADHIEATQIGTASELLEQARLLLADEAENREDLRLLVARLAGALQDVLRLATSRGDRLAHPDEQPSS